MSEIVGLDDGKLLRSDYVYDTTQGKKQSEINTELITSSKGAINVIDVSNYSGLNASSGTMTTYQFGKYVTIQISYFAVKSVSNNVVCVINLSDLGLPNNLADANGVCMVQIGIAGELYIRKNQLEIRSNGVYSSLWGQVTYIAV